MTCSTNKKLTTKQARLVDFYFSFLSERGYSPQLSDTVNATGFAPGNIGSTVQAMIWKGLLEMERFSGRGRNIAITAVNHPTLGRVELEETVYDKSLGASYFASDAEELPPIINRDCLCCSRHFETRGRFSRLCSVCREDADDYSTITGGGYVSNALAVSWGNPGSGIGKFKNGTK